MRYWLCLLAVLLTFPAQACLWAGGETKTFFQELPRDSDLREINAEVKIDYTAIDPLTYKRESNVTVITAIKGIRKGDKLHITSDNSDCARDIDLQVGQTYFISGDRDADRVFHGTWDGLGKFIWER